MVHPEDGEAVNPRVCMAERTLIAGHTSKRCRDMPGTRRLRLHTNICPAVARLTDSSKGRMANRGLERSPDSGQVANVALRNGRHVVRQFDVDVLVSAAMTGGTTGCRNSRVGVRSNQRQPGNSCPVTDIARLRSRNMGSCRFSGSVDIVMAGRALAGNHTCMVVTGWFPDGCYVANIARLGRRDVGNIFRLGVDGHIGPAMTAHAIPCSNRSGESGMGHGRRRKNRVVLMTGITLRRRRDVVAWLTERIRSVVAG